MPRLTRALHLAALGFIVALLAACATGPSTNISLIPANKVAQETAKEGLFTQPVRWKHKKPDCKGECPTLELDSIVFPGIAKFSELIDHALATMTGVGSKGVPAYDTVAEYQDYFWKTAAPRDSAVLSAKVRYRNKDLTVVEMNTYQYYTGAAHGISATQFLNWNNATKRVLGMTDILEPGKHDAYVQALKAIHDRWLANNADARHDPESYNRIWPFQASDNFAFTDQGLAVKYDSYQIAPYYFGQPELLIPYSALRDILRPEFLPAAS